MRFGPATNMPKRVRRPACRLAGSQLLLLFGVAQFRQMITGRLFDIAGLEILFTVTVAYQ